VIYAACLALTWWFYLCRSPAAAGAPNIAEARV
jgi:NNP family nitrate/nitrite transporter-like MFS transporter